MHECRQSWCVLGTCALNMIIIISTCWECLQCYTSLFVIPLSVHCLLFPSLSLLQC